MPDSLRHPSSFKDPSGFVFPYAGKIYRQVNKAFAENYDLFIQTGLYDLLRNRNVIIRHEEVKENLLKSGEWYLTLLPEQISFWSYPYEWCFDQLKDAALLTLDLVKISVEKGLIVKDATPFNIQFVKGRPVFIDTLSFVKYDESLPWIAYRQFCEGFLYPLLLSHYYKKNFQNQLYIYPEGIPVDLVAKILPAKSNLNPAVWLHVHLPNKMGKKRNTGNSNLNFNKKKLLTLIDHLRNVLLKLDHTYTSAWSKYYTETISGNEYIEKKEKIVHKMLQQVEGKTILDIGANLGYFSILAAKNNYSVVAIDNDEQSINTLYKKIKEQQLENILPLCVDISNPSGGSGFANTERNPFNERAKTDAVMALALVHHLAIGKNIPFDLMAEYFSKLAPQLIIEFVPKEDEKTKLLLLNKKDIYPNYSAECFENTFLKYFQIKERENINGSERIIYLMKRIGNK
ncbi:MAG TPA: hypothetical protein VI548_02885 [Chitinophagaceae bacterium]|nr:hypothetical protein [Chitinophagaceae bacterium]